MHVEAGSVQVCGKLAYSAQQPWVYSATVRQNIVFGNTYDKTWYDEVIRACALDRDIELLLDGDQTIIGERGVTLSGGQRARISLARAVYHNADVYILDDPCSAVDASVGKHIFRYVIRGLLDKRTRILVTHQLQYLQYADKIVVMNQGKMEVMGSYDLLTQAGIDFLAFLKTNAKENQKGIHELKEEEADQIESLESTGIENDNDQTNKFEETKQEGIVSWKAYWAYLLTGTGMSGFLFLVLLHILAQSMIVMSDYWLALWSDAENRATNSSSNNQFRDQYKSSGDESNSTAVSETLLPLLNSTTDILESRMLENPTFIEGRVMNIVVYAVLVALLILFGLSRLVWSNVATVLSARKLHDRMMRSVIRAPMRFFDTNTTGRILNRFSKDINDMDEKLTETWYFVMEMGTQVVAFSLVSVIVNPWLMFALLVSVVSLVSTTVFYIRSGRELERLHSVSRSPVLAHIRSTLDGLTYVRAFGIQRTFIKDYCDYQNVNTSAWLMNNGAKRWHTVFVNLISSFFLTCIAFGCVLAKKDMNMATVAFILTFAFQQSGIMPTLMTMYSDMEKTMVSVERVLEYIKLSPEADLESIDYNKPPKNWPVSGIIDGKDVKLRYGDDLPYVLDRLNFQVNTFEKVGIIGRTGAGKSSLITIFFRLAEPEGCMLIDGIDIKTIGLHDLRRVISIIPQDPVLFRGSLRRNLDPFQEFSDNDLWVTLYQVKMDTVFKQLNEGLECDVSEGGANFSVGERQLLCLARALLRRNHILILDEATANVDHATDATIQKTIKESFKSCTVLTIAHRLQTIMNADRLMVLDSGRIVEFDTPLSLMNNPDSRCYQMASKCGPQEVARLTEIARLSPDSSSEEDVKIIDELYVNDEDIVTRL